MKQSNIAVPDDPLWLLLELFKIDPVDDPCHSISPTGTEDGFYRIIIQHLLKVSQSFIVGTGEVSRGIAAGCLTHFYHKAPFFLQYADTFSDLFSGHVP